MNRLKEHFFWRFAYRKDGIFTTSLDKLNDNIKHLIHFADLYFLYLIFSNLYKITLYKEVKIMDPLWPIIPFANFSPVGLTIVIQSITLITLLFIFFYPRKQVLRILFFVGFFFNVALDNSFGKLNHGLYLPLMLSFFLSLIPSELSKNREEKTVLIIATAQFSLLLVYTLTGFWKIFWGVIEFFTKEVSLFSPLSFRNTIIYQFDLTGKTTVGEWFLEHYILGYLVYLFVIYIEFFSITIFFKGNLLKIWGILLVLIHMGINLILGVNFSQNIIVIGLLLVYSPFNITTPFKNTILSLPLISELNYLRKKRA